MSLHILFYTPFNSRSRDTETLMLDFTRQGHKVFLLTHAAEGPYHQFAKQHGVEAFAAGIPQGFAPFFYLRQLLFLLRFIKKNKIRLVYAHLEPTALVASFARFIMPSVVFFACRHSVDEPYLSGNKNFIRVNKWCYRLAKYVIVVSERAKQFMIEKEKIRAEKIRVINLAYDFSIYPPVSADAVNAIKEKYAGEVLLLTACRLVESKRPEISIRVMEQLVKEKGIANARLLMCGEGPLKNSLEELIKNKGLEKNISLTGQVNNMLDYLSATDILLHPSILDSSSVIIKEAGLCKKTVITCRDVGDVNDYLIHDENALLVQRDDPADEMTKQVMRFLQNKISMTSLLGENLHAIVKKRFHIGEISPVYRQMHEQIEANQPPF